MNLIEQLGGYEKAKGFLGESDGADWNGVFYMPKLKQALLEYRRQHNKYEVGDWVFPRANGSGFRAMQIKKITKTFIYANHLILNVEHWRHATDDEINEITRGFK